MVDNGAPVEVDLRHLAEDAQVDRALAIDGLNLVLQAVVATCEEDGEEGYKYGGECRFSHDDIKRIR